MGLAMWFSLGFVRMDVEVSERVTAAFEIVDSVIPIPCVLLGVRPDH